MSYDIQLGHLDGLKRSIQTTENLKNCVTDLEVKKILCECSSKLRKRQYEIKDELSSKGYIF